MPSPINATHLIEWAQVLEEAARELWATNRPLADRLTRAQGRMQYHVEDALQAVVVPVEVTS